MGCVPKVGLCTQILAWYEATGYAKWLRKLLLGIDNGRQQQYTIRMFFTSMATCQLYCQTLWWWVICCKGENSKSYESIEHQSIKQVLADPFIKGLPPKSTWVLREAFDFWITKGPKERLRSCFNIERCIVAVNLTVTDSCHDKTRPMYWSAMRWGQ